MLKRFHFLFIEKLKIMCSRLGSPATLLTLRVGSGLQRLLYFLTNKNFPYANPKNESYALIRQTKATSNQAAFSQTLSELRDHLELLDMSRIQFIFKANRVTACCRRNHYNFGVRGATLDEALQNLIQKVHDRIQGW